MAKLGQSGRRYSLRLKISLILLSVVAVSLSSYALYSIQQVIKDKRRFLYYSTLLESAALGDKVLAEIRNAAETQLSSCNSIQMGSNKILVSALIRSQIDTDPELKDLLQKIQATKELGRTAIGSKYLLVSANTPLGNLCTYLVSLERIFSGEFSSKILSNVFLYNTQNQENSLVFQGAKHQSQSDKQKTHPVVKEASALPISQGTVDFQDNNKKTFVGSYYKIKESPLILISETPYDDFGQILRQVALELVLFGVGVGALVVFFGNRFSSQVTQPLDDLMHQADDLAAGKYDLQKRVTSRDEIGELSEHFTRLAARLQERESQLKVASDLADRDGMTGLYNYRSFRAKLEELLTLAQRNGWPMGVILIDVDHFKAVNDTYGHPQGDQVLKTFAEVFQKCSRSTDMACRYGGEEFVILAAPSTHDEGLMTFAERVRKTIEDTPIPLLSKPGEFMKKTISIGVAHYQADNSQKFAKPPTPEMLIKIADTRLYEAKRGGRNQVKGEIVGSSG